MGKFKPVTLTAALIAHSKAAMLHNINITTKSTVNGALPIVCPFIFTQNL